MIDCEIPHKYKIYYIVNQRYLNSLPKIDNIMLLTNEMNLFKY
jgi:hypothetical protein